MTTDAYLFCDHLSPTGSPCYYLEGQCPLHGFRALRNGQPDDILEVRMNPRELARKAMEIGDADPLDISRVVRAAQALEDLEDEDQDEMPREQALAEIELMGRLMNGLPPRDVKQWEMARAMYDQDSFIEFCRWTKLYDLPYPPDMEPHVRHVRSWASPAARSEHNLENVCDGTCCPEPSAPGDPALAEWLRLNLEADRKYNGPPLHRAKCGCGCVGCRAACRQDIYDDDGREHNPVRFFALEDGNSQPDS